VLLGWGSRRDILGVYAAAVVKGGMFRPIALVGGRAYTRRFTANPNARRIQPLR
jgi:hypothetical protein